jgi:hypothetical protein
MTCHCLRARNLGKKHAFCNAAQSLLCSRYHLPRHPSLCERQLPLSHTTQLLVAPNSDLPAKRQCPIGCLSRSSMIGSCAVKRHASTRRRRSYDHRSHKHYVHLKEPVPGKCEIKPLTLSGTLMCRSLALTGGVAPPSIMCLFDIQHNQAAWYCIMGRGRPSTSLPKKHRYISLLKSADSSCVEYHLAPQCDTTPASQVPFTVVTPVVRSRTPFLHVSSSFPVSTWPHSPVSSPMSPKLLEWHHRIWITRGSGMSTSRN